ncbi:hypothetical protein [Streptomyces bluensis]|uniref:Uncharacterized protein n=1 Tax=Streptomyces bluensis TaxID=33897 RepID=A0ABW6UPC9_9ACTN
MGGLPLLYHGEDATTWPVLRAALEDGHQTRTGFEDGIHLADPGQHRTRPRRLRHDRMTTRGPVGPVRGPRPLSSRSAPPAAATR